MLFRSGSLEYVVGAASESGHALRILGQVGKRVYGVPSINDNSTSRNRWPSVASAIDSYSLKKE